VHALTVSSDARLGGRVNNAMSGLSVTSSRAESGPRRIIRCNMWRYGPLTQGCSRCWTGCPKGLRAGRARAVPSLKRRAPDAVLQTLRRNRSTPTNPCEIEEAPRAESSLTGPLLRTTPARAWSRAFWRCVSILPLAGTEPACRRHVAMTRCRRLTAGDVVAPVPSLMSWDRAGRRAL
jgi:hypothetical protein